MSLNQKVALQVIEEPEIIEINPDGTEVTREKPTEEQNFLRVWESKQMKIENLNSSEEQSPQAEVKQAQTMAFFHLQEAKRDLLKTLQVLENTVLTAQEPNQIFSIDHITKNFDAQQFLDSDDMALGSRIVDKQMQLQDSSEKLYKSMEELKTVVDNSKQYFRKLEQLQKKVHLQSRLSILTNSTVVTVENPVRFPPTTSGACISFDTDAKELKWDYSNKLRLLINGENYFPNTDSSFINFNVLLLQENIYKHFLMQSISQSENYATSPFSQSITESGFTFSQNVTYKEGKVCPVWLPSLSYSSIPPKSLPLTKFKAVADGFLVYEKLYKLISERFMQTDFCIVSISHKNKFSTFKISSLYTSNTVVASCKGTTLYLSTPRHLKQTFILDMKLPNSYNTLRHWADVIWFDLFGDAVEAITKNYGIKIEKEKNLLKLICNDRTISISPTHEPTHPYFIISSKGHQTLSFFYQYIQGYSLEFKLKFLITTD